MHKEYPLYRVNDDLFNDLGALTYGDYDYTDRNPKRSNENVWFWTAIGGRYKREY